LYKVYNVVNEKMKEQINFSFGTGAAIAMTNSSKNYLNIEYVRGYC